MAIINLQNVNKIYRTNDIETVALENVNLEVEKGEFISIMGPSGCGKSTLLNIIGLRPPRQPHLGQRGAVPDHDRHDEGPRTRGVPQP